MICGSWKDSGPQPCSKLSDISTYELKALGREVSPIVAFAGLYIACVTLWHVLQCITGILLHFTAHCWVSVDCFCTVWLSSLSKHIFITCFYFTQVKVCSREAHSPSRASKIYWHNAFQITHLHTTVINSGRATQPTTAHTVGLRCGASFSTDCGYNPGWCLSHPTISEMT